MARNPKAIRKRGRLNRRERLEAITDRAMERVDAMQTPEAKAGVRALFDATPQELGQAAVKGARAHTHKLLLARVRAKAIDTLGLEKADGWLEAPNRALGGGTPLSLLGSDDGAQAVLNVLVRIDYGVFS